MQNKKFFLLLIIVMIFTSGCVKTLNEDLKAKETKLVLNAILNPDSILSVNLSRTFNVFDDESSQNLPFVNNATVSLYKNNDFLFNLIASENGYYSKPDYFPLANAKYQIKASTGSYKSIEAQVSIPKKVSIITFDTSSYSYTDEYEGENTKYIGEINYKDPSEHSNYYQLSCKIFATYGMGNEKKWQAHDLYVEESNDFLFDKSYGRLLWNDKYTNGREVDFSFGFYSNYAYTGEEQAKENDTLQFVFSLQSIDKDYYIYLKTLHLYNETSGGSNPFMEPVIIHSNVTNGYGIFGGYQQDTATTSLIVKLNEERGDK